jgi:transposase
VTIGVDPHPGSLTVSAVNAHGRVYEQLTVVNDDRAWRSIMAWAERYPDRRWAIEGPGNPYVRGFVARLLAEGERVYPIAPAMTAQYRSRRARGKDDEIDATNAARALLANEDLPAYEPMAYEADLKELTRSYQRLSRQLTATRKSVRQMSSEVVQAALSDVIRALEQAVADLKRRMETIAHELAPSLLSKQGVGPVVAATVLAEAGRIDRFPDQDHFASYAGAAPIHWASGAQDTVRVNPGGNRRLNWAAHIVALGRLRTDPRTRAYRDRKLAEGKSKREVMRLLKTFISREFYKALTQIQGPSYRPGVASSA